MEVTARDIKIGNLIYAKGKVITVESIHKDGVNVNYGDGDNWIEYLFGEDLTGVPLDEQWLIRAGFEKDEDCSIDNAVVSFFTYGADFVFNRISLMKNGKW